MPTISKIFIDTNVFVASRDLNDSTHLKAINLFNKLVQKKVRFYTSSDIIGESLTVISRKLGKNEAIHFLNEVNKIADEIFIDEKIHGQARKLYKRIKAKNISFIDCSSVVAMKRNRIKIIFSFDEDFRNLGVVPVSDIFKN